MTTANTRVSIPSDGNFGLEEQESFHATGPETDVEKIPHVCSLLKWWPRVTPFILR